jgi:DNA-binding response OmpR family regulator
MKRTVAVNNDRVEVASDREMKKPIGPPGRRVLVVDDDIELCRLVSRYLKREGFTVEVVYSGKEGLEQALSREHAIVVLDVMLPDMKGFEVLQLVRAHSRMPVLMLTARGDEHDRILGLEMGADDYLPKPFNPRELSARIDAILRRSPPGLAEANAGPMTRFILDDVELDKSARIARRGGQKVDLTTAEFDLLEQLLRSAGRVLSRDELVRAVLGREFSPFDRSIDNHVSNLRRKLGPRSDGLERIKGVRGTGYLYTAVLRDSGEGET